MSTRTADVITVPGVSMTTGRRSTTSHLARGHRSGVVLACTGRHQIMVMVEDRATADPSTVTCKACKAGLASGRIIWGAS